MLTLALIGDLHYPVIENESIEFQTTRERFFSKFMNEFLRIPADYHLSIGDLTHHGKQDEFKQIYNEITSTEANWKHVLGNHDLYSLRKKEVEVLINQPRYQAFTTEEGLIVLLDTTRERRPDDWSGIIDFEQYEWLEKLVHEHTDLPIFVFAHHPLYNTTTRSAEWNGSIVPEDAVHQLLTSHKRGGYYFCGHCHVHSIFKQNQWSYIQTAAVYDHPVARLVTIHNGRLDTSLYEIGDDQLAKDAQFIHHNVYKQETPFHTLGRYEDQKRTLSLS
ncbi:metallophosphoesterase [Geomicrobium sp. JCM 19038]|uniref:metallophosphoesterase family protein n=1 Tax=Geomicrobium sp. JCM 19038 TaxID=1460635 RepID=UPI00045F445F|nr:metallophosphoesterase [Geomicrobium sp. JCM 19038]GAK08223.1 hypothetical protein JCM19038_1998 [Geomicrobium sp. JCM 19038]